MEILEGFVPVFNLYWKITYIIFTPLDFNILFIKQHLEMDDGFTTI